MKIGTLRVTGGKFRLPCVYELLNIDGERLYIGFSAYGFGRVFRRNRDESIKATDQHKRFEAYAQADTVRVTVFDNLAEAAQEERRLILLYHPRFNTAVPSGRHPRVLSVTKVVTK